MPMTRENLAMAFPINKNADKLLSMTSFLSTVTSLRDAVLVSLIWQPLSLMLMLST
jgi:hypothetical protein